MIGSDGESDSDFDGDSSDEEATTTEIQSGWISAAVVVTLRPIHEWISRLCTNADMTKSPSSSLFRSLHALGTTKRVMILIGDYLPLLYEWTYDKVELRFAEEERLEKLVNSFVD
jgi:hypothetical protein